MRKTKSRKISDPWKDVVSPRTRKKADKEWPKANWMEKEKRELSRVKKSKRK